mgnify:FL=1
MNAGWLQIPMSASRSAKTSLIWNSCWMLTEEAFSEKNADYNDKFGGNIRMFDGFLRVAAATPDIRVADCNFNGASAAALVSEAYEQGVSLLVLPELCLTGYTCSDLFLQESLLDGAGKALLTLTEATRDKNMVVLAGLPLTVNGVLYNVAAVLHDAIYLDLYRSLICLLIQNFMKDAIITAVRILRQMFYLMEERIRLVPDFCSEAVRCRLLLLV